MQQQHQEVDDQFGASQSRNGYDHDRAPQALHVVDGGVTAAGDYDGDVTPSEEHQDEVTAAVTIITEHRADIERAKGMLMLIHGMDDPEAAFELLRWRSQTTNTKLRRLARQVVADFLALGGRETLPPRSTYDNLLLTAHLRVDSNVESEDDTG